MRAEFNSRRLFGITRSKGKMYELGLPEDLHIRVPVNDQPLQLFLLTIGTLGDVAAYIAASPAPLAPLPPDMQTELNFSASYFDAVIESQFAIELEHPTRLLAAAAYYLARRPGSSLVLARRIDPGISTSNAEKLLVWLLRAEWQYFLSLSDSNTGDEISDLSKAIAFHFYDGSGTAEILNSLEQLREITYRRSSSRDLLYIDLASAICKMRLAASAWSTLPRFSALPADAWANVIRKPSFPKELWPSQMLLGKHGLFSGASALVQMPTSAGKTRSIEIILRGSFMAKRTKLAIIVAPFRALCHEIALSLRQDLTGENVKINELTDALQLDFLSQVAELFGEVPPSTAYVLVLTPEKLLYVLRQSPQALKHIGLVIYDEGHQFDSGNRGITYELLLTEIKQLLPPAAQTVLISAVMQNPASIASWLLGEGRAQVIDGATLLPTSRAVAFASWADTLGQLMFYERGDYQEPDYFVPRVIEATDLSYADKDSRFPTHKKSSDISLYLGLRVVKNGAVAIFCGTKSVAAGIAKRAVEVANAGYKTNWPSRYANETEIEALARLISGNFGPDSILTRAAELGVFTHHSNTPHGLRLALEFSMQHSLINFIACTSTLAQGVNLPIRYLIVTSIYQGEVKVKVRDFQNLIGRAGRSGMHTEGVVVFADTNVYDTRRSRSESWRFSSSVELLSPDKAEGVTSSLLLLLAPIKLPHNMEVRFSAGELLTLLDSADKWGTWAASIAEQVPGLEEKKRPPLAKSIQRILAERLKMVRTIESYLMANRISPDDAGFVADAIRLSRETLAFALASQNDRQELESLFTLIAQRVLAIEPEQAKQAAFGKTLLGAKEAKHVERWVDGQRDLLLTLDSNEAWLEAVLPLFSEISDDKFFRNVEPIHTGRELASAWLQGAPYFIIFELAERLNAKKQAGTRRMKVSNDDVLDFLESTLAFECALILAAVSQFLFGPSPQLDSKAAVLSSFQKSLKYGLPDVLSISTFEYGFADRNVAQELTDALRQDGFAGDNFESATTNHMNAIGEVASSLPVYFAQLANH